MGLRGRLMLFYGLIAIAPILLAGYPLYSHLGTQTTQSLQHLQQKAEQQLQQYHRTTNQVAEQILTEALNQVQPALEHQLHQFRETARAQQSQVLRKGLQQFSENLQQNLQTVQRETEQSTQKAFTEANDRINTVQSQALATLLRESSKATKSAVTELIKAQLNLLAESLSRQIQAIGRNYTTQLTLIAQQPAIQTRRETESRWILQSLQDREPAYQLLALLDAKGRPQQILDDLELNPDLLESLITPLWQTVQQAEDPVVGNPTLLTVVARPTPYIPILMPIRQRGTELVGAVFALVAMDDVHRLLQTCCQQGTAWLIAADGTVLAHSDPKYIGEKAPLAVQAISAGTQEIDTPQGRIVLATARLPEIDAILVVTQPAQEVFQLVASLQQQLEQSYRDQSVQSQLALVQIQAEVNTQLNQQKRRAATQLRSSLRQAQQRTQSQLSQTLDTLSQHHCAQWLVLLRDRFDALQADLYSNLTRVQAQMFDHTRQQFGRLRQQIEVNATNQIQTAFLLALTTVAVCLLISSTYLHHTLVRPLRAIVETSYAIGQGNLSQRVQLPFRGCPDLNRLADSLNQMIDSLRQAEAQIIQSSKLASLGTLASGVAHELNQPLAIIRAIAQQNLQTLQKGTLSQEAQSLLREDLQIVERQTARMSQIILHLRTFARKPRETQDAVNLNEVAQSALILLREQLRQRGIRLVEQYTEPLPPVIGEANALEQIVINLLTNARDALEGVADPEIRLWTEVVQQQGALWVVLGIADNGPGVPEAIRAQIFDPFFTTKDPNKGTGLGLSISLEIAQKHKGTLQLEPTERGACFVLRLPAGQIQSKAA